MTKKEIPKDIISAIRFIILHSLYFEKKEAEKFYRSIGTINDDVLSEIDKMQKEELIFRKGDCPAFFKITEQGKTMLKRLCLEKKGYPEKVVKALSESPNFNPYDRFEHIDEVCDVCRKKFNPRWRFDDKDENICEPCMKREIAQEEECRRRIESDPNY